MSAIFGFYHLDQTAAAVPDLARMDAALVRHGVGADPHAAEAGGGGLWCEGPVGLGRRSLAFTPQDRHERQPLVGAEGRVALVGDVRLDNRDELVPALGLTGVADLPDGELILRAYLQWGRECVRRLVGVYAFALWDGRSQTLLAARSPIVAPALVYGCTARTLAFATMPSAIQRLPGFPCRLDEQTLARLLTWLPTVDGGTLYQGIRQLPTGHRLVADAGGLRLECFWQPDLAHTLHFRDEGECLEAFTALFTRVVDDALVSTSSIALQLSGGLDSAAVAAVAAPRLAARGARLAAYTEVPNPASRPMLPRGAYADETPLVQAIAAQVPGLELTLVRTDGQTFLTGLDALFDALEVPIRNAANWVWLDAILGEAGRRGQRVVLDGMQGNLTLSYAGDGLLPELIRAHAWGDAAGHVRRLARQYGLKYTLRQLFGQLVLAAVPGPAYLGWMRLRHPRRADGLEWRSFSPIRADFAMAQGIPEAARAPEQLLRRRPTTDTRRTRYDALMQQDFGFQISGVRALHGVDMRSPTADVRLTEFCLALPEAAFQRDGETRRLVRRAMAGRLPQAVLENRRRGMQAADAHSRLAGAPAPIADTLHRIERSDLAPQVLDLPRLREIAQRLAHSPDGSAVDYIELHHVFATGLMVGSFIGWFEARRGA